MTFIQRFGSAANLNVHLHVLVLDGVFTEQSGGALAFNPAPPPTTQEVNELLTTARKRILRHLGKHGLLDDDRSDVDPLSEQASLLASCYATSIARRQTLGAKMVLLACITQRAVIAKILRHLGFPSEPPRPAQARASPRSQSQLDHIA